MISRYSVKTVPFADIFFDVFLGRGKFHILTLSVGASRFAVFKI